MIYVTVLVILLSLIGLAVSSTSAIRAFVQLGQKLHWSEFTVGFIVLGLMTSTPEMFIAGQSVLDRTPELSIGNLIGASVVLVTLILGSVAVVQNGLTASPEVRRHDMLWMALLILAPVVATLDGSFSKIDGLAIICLYLIYIYHFATRHSYVAEYGAGEAQRHPLSRIVVLGALGLIGLTVFSKLAVEFSLHLAREFSLSPAIVGLLILGVGTNLPEIALALSAIRHRHEGIVYGDLLGSAAGNSFVAAAVALSTPVAFARLAPLTLAGITLVITLVLFDAAVHASGRISRQMGLVFVLLYLVFITTSLLTVRSS